MPRRATIIALDDSLTEKRLDSVTSQTYLNKISYTCAETVESWAEKSTIQI